MTRKKSTVLEGKNIYYDKHGRALYYRKREKRAYRIPFEKASTFKTLEPRFLYGILMFIFAYFLFKFNFYICLGLSVISVIFMEYRFRKFLANCTIIENYNPQNGDSTAFAVKASYRDLAIRSILYLLLGILLIINAYTADNLVGKVEIQVLSDIVGVFLMFIGLRYIGIIFKKKKLEKDESQS